MRTFSEFPANTICPICESSKQGETVLITIDGTDDGHGNCEATPVHVECLATDRLHHNKDAGVLYIKLRG